jgi:hypothetical protein
VVEVLGFAAAGLVGLAAVRVSPSMACASQRLPLSAYRWQKRLLAIYVIVLTFGLLGIAAIYCAEPHGGWDAWDVWNMRARFLFRSGDGWHQAFAPVFQHADYPLLVPISVARCWSYLGRDPTWTPLLVGSLFTFAAVGTLTAGISRLRSPSQGMLAGIVLSGTAAYLSQGASQFADVPVGMFLLATVLLLALYDVSDSSSRRLLFLAGLTAAMAAWTKNEGLLLLVIVLAVRSVVAWRRGGGPSAARQIAFCIAGAAPVIGIVILFKLTLATHNELVGGQSWQTSLRRLLDASRYWFIAKSLAYFAFRVSKGFAVVLPLYFLLVGRTRTPASRALPAIVGVIATAMAGYFLVYVVTPYDLHWHVTSSADRLILQLWPSALVAIFLCLSDPVRQIADASTAAPPPTASGSVPRSAL